MGAITHNVRAARDIHGGIAAKDVLDCSGLDTGTGPQSVAGYACILELAGEAVRDEGHPVFAQDVAGA